MRTNSVTDSRLFVGSLRLAFQYDRQLAPVLAVSVRTGVAVFGGGTIPWFLEIRQVNRLGPLVGGLLRPFGYLGFGMIRIEPETEVDVPIYAQDAERASPAIGYRRVEAQVDSMGWLFISNGFGLSGAFNDRWRLEAEVGFVLTAPEGGISWRSGLGLFYDF